MAHDSMLALERHAAQGDMLRKDAAHLSAVIDSHWTALSSALECEAEGAAVLLLAQQRRQADALAKNLRAAAAIPSAAARRRDAGLRLQEKKLRARGDTRDARAVALKRRHEAAAERGLRRSAARARESNLLALQSSRHEAQREQLRACYAKHRAKLQRSRNEEMRRVVTRDNVCRRVLAHADHLVRAKVEADAGRARSDAGRIAPFRARGGMAAARAEIASRTADVQAAAFCRTIESTWASGRRGSEVGAPLQQCGTRCQAEKDRSQVGQPQHRRRQRRRKPREQHLCGGAAAWRRLGSHGAPAHPASGIRSGVAQMTRCWWTGMKLRPGQRPKCIPGSDAIYFDAVVGPSEPGVHLLRGGSSCRHASSKQSRHGRPHTAPVARAQSVRAVHAKVALQPPPGRDIGVFISWQAAREWNAQCSPLSQRWLRSLRIDAAEAAELAQDEQLDKERQECQQTKEMTEYGAGQYMENDCKM